MTGALPATQWLDCCVALDEKSFIRTGLDLALEDLPRERWRNNRMPESFETVFPESLRSAMYVAVASSGSPPRLAKVLPAYSKFTKHSQIFLSTPGHQWMV
jgi:hypothetical protein